MNPDLSKAYELLGVKPGVSSRELKAAHRDLAKVWHPDRFLHDPRLQERAQEKLKEINEAYELLSSGMTPRATTPPPWQKRSHAEATATTPRQGNTWQWAAVPLLVFVAVFAVTITTLLQKRSEPVVAEQPQIEELAGGDQETSTRPDSNSRADAIRKANEEDFASQAISPDAPASEPTPALQTVTVTIDPESGLIARQDCPLRSRMTYPSGNEPSGHCNLPHTPPPKESRIKSLTKTVRALE